MPINQGDKLKKLIENSRYKINEISEKTNIPISSLYDIFKKKEVLMSKVLPILNLLNYSYAEFIGIESPIEINDYKLKIEKLENENKQLLKDKINLLEQLNELNIKHKKTSVSS